MVRVTAPQVSVVIPCRNEARYIENLLNALAQQDYKDFEVIIADGQSTDGTPAIVRRYMRVSPGFPLKFVSNPHCLTPFGLNSGIGQAVGDIIVRLDGHSRPAPNYLSRCLAVLAESGAEVVGGAWDICPGGPGLAAEAIALAVSCPLGAGDALYRLKDALPPRDVDTVPFGCFRRQTWEAMGGYNESLPRHEDYEFNLRVRLRGGRVRFDPSIRCEYFARPTFSALADQYWHYGWIKAHMLMQHPRSLRLRQAIPLAGAGGGLVMLALSLPWPALRPAVLLVWGIYLVIVLLYAGRLAWRKNARLWPALALAFVTIHFSWGLGAWAGLGLGWIKRRPEEK